MLYSEQIEVINTPRPRSGGNKDDANPSGSLNAISPTFVSAGHWAKVPVASTSRSFSGHCGALCGLPTNPNGRSTIVSLMLSVASIICPIVDLVGRSRVVVNAYG